MRIVWGATYLLGRSLSGVIGNAHHFWWRPLRGCDSEQHVISAYDFNEIGSKGLHGEFIVEIIPSLHHSIRKGGNKGKRVLFLLEADEAGKIKNVPVDLNVPPSC